ncbi:MAG: biotin--[acetyl-CoA-carboxylase] ligase, partial [Acidimicrobiia bacterium]
GKGSSLLVSILLRPDLPPGHLAVVPLACALSLAAALEEVAGFRPGLKWPNDLVVGERKMAGILAETDLVGGEVRGIVVGAGVNIGPGSFPPELADLATTAELVAGQPVERGALLVAYLVALEGAYRSLLGTGGPEALLEACRVACVTLGREVRVEVPGGTLRGTAETLGAGGELVVMGPGGERESVSAGDVVHLRDASQWGSSCAPRSTGPEGRRTEGRPPALSSPSIAPGGPPVADAPRPPWPPSRRCSSR